MRPNPTLRSLLVAMTSISLACSSGEQLTGPSNDPTPTTPTTPTNPTNPTNPGTKRLTAADSASLATRTALVIASDFKNLRNWRSVAFPTEIAQPGCAPSLSSRVDANANGIPDDATLTFTAQNCNLSQGAARITATGSIRVQDLGGIWGYRVTISNLRVSGSAADTSVVVAIDGVYEVQHVSATSARTLNRTKTILELRAGRATIASDLSIDLISQFTPDAGRSLATSSSLPPGTLAVTGSYAMKASVKGIEAPPGTPTEVSATVTLSTPTPLHFNGSCQAEVPFDGGELKASVTGSGVGELTARFERCMGSSGGPKR